MVPFPLKIYEFMNVENVFLSLQKALSVGIKLNSKTYIK